MPDSVERKQLIDSTFEEARKFTSVVKGILLLLSALGQCLYMWLEDHSRWSWMESHTGVESGWIRRPKACHIASTQANTISLTKILTVGNKNLAVNARRALSRRKSTYQD